MELTQDQRSSITNPVNKLSWLNSPRSYVLRRPAVLPDLKSRWIKSEPTDSLPVTIHKHDLGYNKYIQHYMLPYYGNRTSPAQKPDSWLLMPTQRLLCANSSNFNLIQIKIQITRNNKFDITNRNQGENSTHRIPLELRSLMLLSLPERLVSWNDK